jgi:hypothetical protein
MTSAVRIVASILAMSLSASAHAETARPQRVAEVVSVKIERLKDGPNGHRITAIGRVTSAGWTEAKLRPTREAHPNNAVAGFEMVAVPPSRKTPQKPTEITATLETTIGAIQHTLIVRGLRKSITCTMTPDPSCE